MFVLTIVSSVDYAPLRTAMFLVIPTLFVLPVAGVFLSSRRAPRARPGGPAAAALTDKISALHRVVQPSASSLSSAPPSPEPPAPLPVSRRDPRKGRTAAVVTGALVLGVVLILPFAASITVNSPDSAALKLLALTAFVPPTLFLWVTISRRPGKHEVLEGETLPLEEKMGVLHKLSDGPD